MTTPFTGEIQIFGFNFPPYLWATADGSMIAISQNTALFALLGTQYGGDGRVTFQLPNLIGRVAIGQGTGPGLTPRDVGDTVGENSVQLLIDEMPMHSHELNVYPAPTTAPAPTAGAGLGGPRTARMYAPGSSQMNTTLMPNVITPSGNGAPHENRQPFLAMNYSIALYGDFPHFD